jgi:hypothetical protein
MRILNLRALALTLATALVPALASCGSGGGGSGSDPDMVLVAFNHPDVAGVPLNEPLIFTFSDDVDPASCTPDTIQVVGTPSFTFERIVVDGPLVALLPSVPTFEDYSDSGLQKGVTYNVFLPVFPAVDTVRSVSGNPLLIATNYTFTTLPTDTFVESRRPLVHGRGRFDSPPGDEDGCVNNLGNEHFGDPPAFQFGTDENASLLCLINEGSPRVLLEASVPTHDQRAVGTPSAAFPGTVDIGAVRIRMNEPVDPLTIVPWTPTTQLGINCQLWRVGDNEGTPLATPVQIRTNKPVVVQDTESCEIFLVAVGPQPQGTYLVNLQGIQDLPGNLIRTDDRPVKPAACFPPPTDEYEIIDCSLVGKVPPGYRYYFRTLELSPTQGSFTESFGNSFSEGLHRLFTFTAPPSNPAVAIPGSPETGATTGFTLTNAEPGQATSANWNDAYRWLGLTGARVNTQMDDGSGRLKAVHQPFLGSGGDGALLVTGNTTLSSSGTDANGDGIFEFDSLTVDAGATLTLTGTRPLQILCRGTVAIDGTVNASGLAGRFGLDTDGSATYTNPGATPVVGVGGTGGPGAGNGGTGGPKGTGVNPQDAAPGGAGRNLFFEAQSAGVGGAGGFGDGTNGGGGGGGYGTAGAPGSGGALGGAATGVVDFARALASFVPDRTYQPNANVAGGAGGGGGGAEDDSAGDSETGDGTSTTADDGGGGGGGGGGAVWILADTITVGSTGVVRANGGRGGNTYAVTEQVIVDPDPETAGDQFVNGVVDENAAGTGQGGGGGGGSGGAVLFQARYALTLDASSVIEAVGGAGGTASGGRAGGQGGDGRIGLMAFPDASFASSGSVTPTPGVTGAVWNPTVDTISQGVSIWYDLSTPTADIVPPFFDSNFSDLEDAGLERGLGADFEAILEFQAASTLTPNENAPTTGTGITPWTPAASVTDGPPDDAIDMKRFVRWRWRFFASPRDVASTNTDPDFDADAHPMPALLQFTLPYQK